MESKLKSLIDNDINPKLSEHRGGCELLSVEDGVASIRLIGSCVGCPGKIYTFEKRVIPYMIENVEGLKSVVIVQDK